MSFVKIFEDFYSKIVPIFFFFFFFGKMKKIYKFNVFYKNLKKNFTNLSGNKTISNFQELFLFSNK
ncbi:hypothetical protein DR105_03815 [Mycoplasma hyorhinis]|nr:hypothetical protein [Mesomycoplasma hyorhinis]